MVLMDFLGAMGGYLSQRLDDDYIDRMHYFMTTNLLIALSILVSYKQFNGKPVECIVGNTLGKSYEEYAENYCWSERTYHYPFSKLGVSTNKDVRYQSTVSYYQWVPFFLLFEAACFRLPSILWRYMAGHSGINVHDIVKLATNPGNIGHETRKQSLNSLTLHLQNALRFHRRLFRRKVRPHRILKPLNLPYTAFFVTFVYLLTKILYMVNVTLQLYILNTFLQLDHSDYFGFGAVEKILKRKDWDETGIFPRVTLCDFQVRSTGSQVQNYTVQCVLVINMFNEKIFVFLWFWFVCLMFLTVFSILYWSVVMLFPWFSRSFVSRHLELSDLPFDPRGSAKDVERFVSGYLKVDGVFIIRMINSHAGIIFATDLVLSLWRAFYGIEDTYRKGGSFDLTPTPPAGALLLPPSASVPLGGGGGKSDKLNILRLRHNNKPSKTAVRTDNTAVTGAVQKALTERLLPQAASINKAILMPAAMADPHAETDASEDADAENRSSAEEEMEDETTPSEESQKEQSPTVARGTSGDTSRLIEEGNKKPPKPPVPPKSQAVKKTVI